MVVYLAYEYLAYEYLDCLDLYSLPRCTNPYDLCCRPVLPLLDTTARSVCAHQVLYMLVRYAQSTRNVARILRVLSQNSRHISCLLAFSGFSCTPTCTCSTPTCALRVRHYINLYDERYAPYGLKTTEKIHGFG